LPEPDKAALIQQLLAMPQATIDAMPPTERAQIMALRAQLMNQYTR
jgi:cleavage stimulation factor subunit 2